MKIVTYEGHSARIEFEAEDGLFVGRMAGINDVIGFHADGVAGFVEAFREAVDDDLATCEAIGKSPEKPFSGKLMPTIGPRSMP